LGEGAISLALSQPYLFWIGGIIRYAFVPAEQARRKDDQENLDQFMAARQWKGGLTPM